MREIQRLISEFVISEKENIFDGCNQFSIGTQKKFVKRPTNIKNFLNKIPPLFWVDTDLIKNGPETLCSLNNYTDLFG